jgi:hypothetical protein
MTASVLDWQRSFNHPSHAGSSFSEINFVSFKKNFEIKTIDHFLEDEISDVITEDLNFSREDVKKEVKLWRKNNQIQ